MYLGRWEVDDLLTFTCNTHTPSTGAAVDADSAPTYRVYEDETGTAILTGTMALLDDANTVGQYSEQITLSAANGFELGKSYSIRISGTVGGAAGATLRSFQVEGDAYTRIGAAGAGLSAVPWNAAWDAEVQSEVADALTAYGASTYAGGAVASVTGNVGGNVTGSVGSVVGAVGSVAAGGITAASIATGAVDADALAADAVAEIADGVWDETLAGHATAGTSGAALSAAGSAGDPWSTALPGAYASGTAGHYIGNMASLLWGALTSALTTVGSIGAYIVSKLGGTTITVTAPVALGGDVLVYIGDDYSNTDSRALDWSSASWPNLTGATITLAAAGARTTGADWTLTGSAPTAGVGSQTVRFQPTSAETALLREGSGHRFQIEATLSSARVVTLVDATLTAYRDIA